MASAMTELGIDRLSLEDRLALVHEIWDSIATEQVQTCLSDLQREELERRLEQHKQAPQDVVPWDRIKTEALSRFQK